MSLLSLSPCGTVPTQPQRTQKGIGCLIPFRQGLPLSWSWATKAQPSCLHLTLALWSQASRSHLAFYMTAGDLNSHLNACKASSLTTGPFPSLSPFIYLSVHLHLLGGEDLHVERSMDNLEAAGSFLPPVELPAVELRSIRLAASALTPEPSWSGFLFTF